MTGHERDQPWRAAAAPDAGGGRECGTRHRAARPAQLQPASDGGGDAVRVPERQGGYGGGSVRKGRRWPLLEPLGAECQPLETVTRRGEAVVQPGAPCPIPHHRRQDEVDERRGAEQRAPGRHQERGSVAQRPDRARRGRSDGEGRDERRAGQTRLQRARVERPVQPRHGLGGIERGAPAKRERETGEQRAQVHPGVRAPVRAPAADVQRSNAEIEQRDHRGGGEGGEQRKPLHAIRPGELGDVVAEVAM